MEYKALARCKAAPCRNHATGLRPHRRAAADACTQHLSYQLRTGSCAIISAAVRVINHSSKCFRRFRKRQHTNQCFRFAIVPRMPFTTSIMNGLRGLFSANADPHIFGTGTSTALNENSNRRPRIGAILAAKPVIYATAARSWLTPKHCMKAVMACVRRSQPSLSRIAETWLLTVPSVSPSSHAICLLSRPRVMSSRISN